MTDKSIFIISLVITIVIVAGIVTWQFLSLSFSPTPSPTFSSSFSPTPSPTFSSSPEPRTSPYIELISPNGGENWKMGETHKIKWKAEDVEKTLSIDICTENPNKHGSMYFCRRIDSGVSSSAGEYDWEIGSSGVDVMPYDSYKILVKYEFYGNNDISDNYFSIIQQGSGDWNTYSSNKYNFEFDYPIYYYKNDMNKQLAYSFNFNYLVDKKEGEAEIASVVCLSGFKYLGAAHLGVSCFGVIVGEEGKNSDCLKTIGGPVTKPGRDLTEKKYINGVTFYKDYCSESGMGHMAGFEIYRTIHNNRCYDISVFKEINTNVEDYGSEEQKILLKEINEELDYIVSTFHFTN